MVQGIEAPTSAIMLKKRKKGPNKRKDTKRVKGRPGMEKKNKVNPKMQKLYRKRARDYNSESDEDEVEDNDDDDDDEKNILKGTADHKEVANNEELGGSDSDAGLDSWIDEPGSDVEDDVKSGFTKFAEGCKAFRIAFKKIIKRHADDETLGPVLSAHRKLVVAKLAEEETERKVKGDAKKEKHLMEEKGHVQPPANFLDTHEKFLIGVATKGVVKLFNAVNKAQNAQKGLNPSRFKDAKALTKRRKEVFFSELSRVSGESVETTSKAKDGEDDSQPAWAPLRDTFMLTNSKLKDWDKMAEPSDI